MPQLLDWKLVSSDGGWHKRRKQATVVYQGSIYIIGGFFAGVGTALNLNDVWRCDDGVNWTRGKVFHISTFDHNAYPAMLVPLNMLHALNKLEGIISIIISCVPLWHIYVLSILL